MADRNKYNFSFAGCGFLGIYQVGVASCLRQYTPHLVKQKVSGASAGAIAATLLLCEASLDDITKVLLNIATQARSRTLGPFSPSFNISKLLRAGIEGILPEDAHLRANGKLHISLTRVWDRQNIIVSHFESRRELVEAVMCATFIPGFSGILPPKFRGWRHMDGGFTDNCPLIDENTVSVSPYSGEADICPKDGHASHLMLNVSNTSFELTTRNLYRLSSTFFPPKPELLQEMCQQGFDDALRFLSINNLIGCETCLLNQVQIPFPEHHKPTASTDPACHQCEFHKQVALTNPKLPDTVEKILQDDINSDKQSFMNWLYSHRSVQVLSLMTLPWVLPADIAYATGIKLFESVPKPNLNPSDFTKLRETLSPLVTQPLSSWTGSPATILIVTNPPFLPPMIETAKSIEAIEFCPPFSLHVEPPQSMDSADSCPLSETELPCIYADLNNLDIVCEYKERSRRGSLEDGSDDSFDRGLSLSAYQDNIVANYYINCDNGIPGAEDVGI